MVTRQVLRTAASVREEIIPAEYATVTRRSACQKEAQTSEQEIPATYQTVTHQVIDIESSRPLATSLTLQVTSSPHPTKPASVLKGGTAKSAGAESGTEGYVREIQDPG